MSNIWLEIIKSELDSAVAVSGTAVSGAKLRLRVAQAAKAKGLEFPPPTMGKFSAFVESFATDFIVQRNPGSDVLIVPVDRPELLAVDTPQTKNARLRQDLFDALTTVGANRNAIAYYLPDADSVTWVAGDARPPPSAVQLPQASLDKELETRRRFAAAALKSDDARDSLHEALGGQNPLRRFGEAIRAHGLVRDWHVFRMGMLTTELREWSVNHAIQWRAEWVEATKLTNAQPPSPTPVPADSRRQLALLVDGLTTEDLSRITVPLDIVLRLLTP